METPIKKSKKSKRIILAIIGILVIAGAVTATLFMTGVIETPASKEKRLTGYMTDLGNEFYTKLFYAQLKEGRSKDDLSKFLKKYEKTGVKVDLDNLSRTTKDNKDKVKSLKDSSCDINGTKDTINPKSPYGQNDYTVKVTLKCKL
ncbi:hypothetical protein FWF48_02435 [Candidatus Saccharibacteria bacterium]|nr:hypothetical protein [Candidatus Saccharibacteria bacterium]